MSTFSAASTWMPSVLGLNAGELIRSEAMVTYRHSSNRKWNWGLSCTFNPSTVTFELLKNLNAFYRKRGQQKEWRVIINIFEG
jgi:hypothetical protein